MMNARYEQNTGYAETAPRLQHPLSNLYQRFIAWSSVYDAVDYESEQEQRKEQVDRRLDEFRNRYLPRSVWMDRRTRRTIEKFIEKCEVLRSEFAHDIHEHGYVRVRTNIADRVSGELRPLKKEIESNLWAEVEEAPPPRRRIFGG